MTIRSNRHPRFSAFQTILVVCSLLCAVASSMLAQAQPAQAPLLSRTGNPVKPNLILTLDDSGSMSYQYMPEVSASVGTFTVAFPNDRSLIMDYRDPRKFTGTFSGTVPGNPDSTAIFQRQMRSPDVNSIYYNPEIRYLPWMTATGTRLPNATPTAARFDPYNISTALTINLTAAAANVNIDGTSGQKWCHTIDTGSLMTCTTDTRKYSPSLYYRLKKDGTGKYLNPNTSGNYDMYQIATGTTFTKYPNRTDCGGTSCTKAEEFQNFANWFQYYRSRLLLTQASVAETFATLDDKLRLGWGLIHNAPASIDGVSTSIVQQGVRDFTTTHKTSLFNWVKDISVVSGTPLRHAVQGVGEYYKRTDNSGPWGHVPGTNNTTAHKTCRRAYHLLMTDGLWNDTGAPFTLTSASNSDNTDGTTIIGPGRSYQYLRTRPYRDDNSNTLADHAIEYWKKDLRTDLDNKVQPTADNPAFWQHLVHFTVGLGVKGALDPSTDLPSLTSGTKSWTTNKVDDLWHAALNSRGKFFSAKNATELSNSLKDALNETVERELKEAGVATAATVLEAGNSKYIPRYRTGVWSGDVESFNLDAAGQAGASKWTASSKLPVWTSRSIFTNAQTLTTTSAVTGVTFTWSSFPSTVTATLSAAGVTSSMVDFLRGDRSKESITGYRERSGVLGDFINSNPVFAKGLLDEGYISLPTSNSSSYATFLNTKASRTGVLYIGGNDGMLHGFLDTRGGTPANDGKEVYAYVPKTVFPNLSKLASQTYGIAGANYHQYYFDGPLREYDAFVKAPGAGSASWRNYLLGTLGAGGRAVLAFDITDPTTLGQNTARWEFSNDNDTDLGFITSPVVAGVLPNGQWVALFGNGYKAGGASKAFLYIRNLETGASIGKIAVDATATDNGLGGITIKKNANKQIVAVYAGDSNGKLWQFNYNAAATGFFDAPIHIFTAQDSGGVAQKITQPPIIYNHSQGGDLVLVGTGQLLTTNDANSTATHSMYGIWVKPSDSLTLPYNRSQLAARSIDTFTGAGGSVFFDLDGTTVDWVSQRGWRVDLSISGYPGLRTIYPPQAVNSDLVLFSTVSPAQVAAECEQSTGQGVNFIFPVETGLSTDYCLFDTNGDGLFNNSDVCDAAAYATGADGIDAILRNPTSDCTGDACLTKYSVQNTTGHILIQAKTAKVSNSSRSGQDRIWRRIINPPIK